MPPETQAISRRGSLSAHATFAPLEIAAATSTSGTRLLTIVTAYAALEFFATAAIAYLYGWIYHRVVLLNWDPLLDYRLAAIVIAGLVLMVSLGFRNFIEITRQPRHVFQWRGVGAVILAFTIFLTLLFITKLTDSYSRGAFLFQIVGVAVVVIILRGLFYSTLETAIASNRIEARQVALIGDAERCAEFAARLKSSGIRVTGAFRLPYYDALQGATIVNPSVRAMVDECRSLRPGEIILLASQGDMPVMFDLASALAELPAGVHIVPVDAPEVLASTRISELGGVQTIQVYRPPLSPFDKFVKRTFDIVAASFGLIVFSPLFLIVSLAIRLDSPGPVFFRQTRHGFNNDEIRVLKFRSMRICDDSEFKQTERNDPRVTRVGRILRSTNIDELPQLINVLRGEMSIVGPRPHATEHNALFHNMIAPFSRRHNVKPGITGWAQVNGHRGATDTIEKMQRRIEYDLQYVDNWSFLFDMKIIMMTLFSKKAYTNAY